MILFLSTALLIVALALLAYQRELDYAKKQMQWEKDRFYPILAVFEAASALAWSRTKKHRDLIYRGGEIYHVGSRTIEGAPAEMTMLNFGTLKSAVAGLLEQDAAKDTIADELTKALKALEVWQEEHPQPNPPTYFGRRIAL